MIMPTILFVLFALLSAIGAYLVLAHHKSRMAAVWGALGTLLFFVLLFGGVLLLLGKSLPTQ